MNKIIQENDRTIFNYLDPKRNDRLSDLSESQIMDLMAYLDLYYLECRDSLAFPSDVDLTFGTEIEMEYFKGGFCEKRLFQSGINDIVGNKKWICKEDWSLRSGYEVASDVLRDVPKTWAELDNILSFVSKYGIVGETCSSQVHVGSQILGENPLWWWRFFKLWSIYENVIYRFCYGDYLTHRPKIEEYARPAASFFQSRLDVMSKHLDDGVLKMLQSINPGRMSEIYLNRFGISYCRMLGDENYNHFSDFNKFNLRCTVELRVPNPDFDVVIRQNLVNFIIKFILYCKRDDFDDDILDRRKIEVASIFSSIDAYSDIYLEQAVELADLIFDNNLDKVYFLRQYIKSFEKGTKPFVRAKRPITATNIPKN